MNVAQAKQFLALAEMYHDEVAFCENPSKSSFREELCGLLEAIPYRKVTGPGQVKSG